MSKALATNVARWYSPLAFFEMESSESTRRRRKAGQYVSYRPDVEFGIPDVYWFLTMLLRTISFELGTTCPAPSPNITI
jgi:hypothetical protein